MARGEHVDDVGRRLAIVVVVVTAACGGGLAVTRPKKPAAYPTRPHAAPRTRCRCSATHNSYHVQRRRPDPGVVGDTRRVRARAARPAARGPGRAQLRARRRRTRPASEFPVVHTPVIDADDELHTARAVPGRGAAVVEDASGSRPDLHPDRAQGRTLERSARSAAWATSTPPASTRSTRRSRSSLGTSAHHARRACGGRRRRSRERSRQGLADARRRRAARSWSSSTTGGATREHLLAGSSVARRAGDVRHDRRRALVRCAVIKVDDPDEAQDPAARQGRLHRAHPRRRRPRRGTQPATSTRRELALRSGAQIVSTDFEVPVPAIGGRLRGADPRRHAPPAATR